MTGSFVPADPYRWPYNGDLRPENTALVVIDMQTDFCGEGGYECLLLEDCCGATDRDNPDAAIKMVKLQGGVFGAVSNAEDPIAALPGEQPHRTRLR